MLSSGSQWRRWEPHIHAPGTVLNNQFGDGDAWDAYLKGLENATPKIQAIAITDYYVLESYQEAIKHKALGRIPDIELLFPNIELRLDVAAKKGFVNIHLLVSPEDADHINQITRILSRLQFNAFGDRFDCTLKDLVALGKRSDPSIINDRAALIAGSTQFKVNFNQLREVFQESEWAKQNILIAVAGGEGDGTSGLRQAADKTIREEIEKFAHIIFSSNPSQREFWLGQKSIKAEVIRERYNGCKPCLHGCDAHEQGQVGQPVDDRFSWIKGALEFDALRQACIDPAGRAYVGTSPPSSAMPSQVISNLSLKNADWSITPDIALNSGLVAIIGARGSGKTALADIIAAGCEALPPATWQTNENKSPSFLVRARPLIKDASVKLTWGGGNSTQRFLDGRDSNDHFSYPKARYLSQQFVEELCSSNGISDGLIQEIERVILEAHPIDEREGAVNFDEFRLQHTKRYNQARMREAEAIADISERIAIEHDKEVQVASLTSQVVQKDLLIKGYNADLAKLVVKGTEQQVKRHTELSTAAQTIRSSIQSLSNQKRTFITLQDEVASTRATKIPELLRQAKERHNQSGLTDEQWDEFLLIYKGQVDKSLESYIKWAEGKIAQLTGQKIEPSDPNTPIIPDTADPSTFPLLTITAEMARLEALFSADKLVREKYAALTSRIATETSTIKALNAKLTDAQGSAARRKDLQLERDFAYERMFVAIIAEQDALAQLYAPLMNRLAVESGTLKKLGFEVRRIVDTTQWGGIAEETLLDRRKSGPFYGKGSLTEVIETTLKPAWESGSAADIQVAMKTFISKHQKDLFAHAPFAREQLAEFSNWTKQFAHWLYSTDHISVRYEIVYDGIDIRKLSPGTRGIVLLLLYLALDESDDRPLIIDQPEENLDPKSVFEELVSLFIAAKTKRQVIMVTHNANLVINTDADQIIVAEVGPHRSGGLPPITYRSGGLESAEIRKLVCDILEGGEAAFRERARRLRVRLER